jgi:hypothetical protein
MIDNKKRFETYKQAQCVLEQLQPVDEINTGAAHLFLGMVVNDGKFDITATTFGESNNIIQLINQVFNNPDTPPMLKKAILNTAANIISGLGEPGRLIGYKVGVLIETNFGQVDCNCEHCRKLKN